MQKSIASHEYRLFLEKLRSAREHAGLTQIDVADRLGETQSFVSKCERGERRLDIIEVRSFCAAIGTSLSAFAEDLEQFLRSAELPRQDRKRRKRASSNAQ